MIVLVSLSYARADRRSYEADDQILQAKLNTASYVVLNHCKLDPNTIPDDWKVQDLSASPPIDEDFDETSLSIQNDGASPPGVWYEVPGNIQAATLLVLGDLFENRESGSAQLLSESVIDLLRPFRDPTFA